jgi:hypothetical protein
MEKNSSHSLEQQSSDARLRGSGPPPAVGNTVVPAQMILETLAKITRGNQRR